MVSHAGARMRAVPITSVTEVSEGAQAFDVVGIDEAQFVGEGIVACALALAERGVRWSSQDSIRTSGVFR